MRREYWTHFGCMWFLSPQSTLTSSSHENFLGWNKLLRQSSTSRPPFLCLVNLMQLSFNDCQAIFHFMCEGYPLDGSMVTLG